MCVAAGLGTIAQQALHSFEAAASRARQALLQAALSGAAADVAEAVRCGQRFAHLQGESLLTPMAAMKLSVACAPTEPLCWQKCASAPPAPRALVGKRTPCWLSTNACGHNAVCIAIKTPALCFCIHTPGSCHMVNLHWFACPAEEVAHAQRQLGSRRQAAEAEVVAALKGDFLSPGIQHALPRVCT